MDYAKKCKIVNKQGFHMRAAVVFVKEAEKFKCDIKVRHGEVEADGKSIMGLMMLVALEGHEIELKASGDDAKEAIAALARLIKNKFGEKK